jgi:hypothetical protein
VTRWPRAGQSGGKTAACGAGATRCVSVADLWCLRRCGPACAGRASPRLSPALTPGQRCRLDSKNGSTRQRDAGLVRTPVSGVSGGTCQEAPIENMARVKWPKLVL